MVYADLQELCKMLRVAKGVTSFYNSIALERKGEGDTYIPYDTGVETDKALTIRSDLSGVLVGQCTVYHAKGDAPWTEEEPTSSLSNTHSTGTEAASFAFRKPWVQPQAHIRSSRAGAEINSSSRPQTDAGCRTYRYRS
jgi:hypothetical protein